MSQLLEPAGQPQRALAGYRVLDLASVQGAMTGRHLAEMGAEVIRVEHPRGSALRRIGPRIRGAEDGDYGLLWLAFNASKHGITLDLEKHDGLEIFSRLTQDADLVIETGGPQRLKRFGLDPKAIRSRNHRLVWTSITGFGVDGPYAGYRVTDLIALALSGLLFLWGDEDRPPTHAAEPQSYYIGSIGAALASVVALRQARRTGEGQLIDVSLQEMATTPLATYVNLAVPLEGTMFSRSGPGMDFLQLKRRVVFECQDGYVVISGVFGIHTPALIELMKSEGRAGFLGEDEKWLRATTAVKLPTQWRVSQEELLAAEGVVGSWLKSHTRQEIFDFAVQHELLIFPILGPGELLNLSHLEARGFFSEVEAGGVTVRLPGPAVRLSETPWAHPESAPYLGQHNAEVYGRLGIDAAKRQSLREAGVI